jgi:hypothetical protein
MALSRQPGQGPHGPAFCAPLAPALYPAIIKTLSEPMLIFRHPGQNACLSSPAKPGKGWRSPAAHPFTSISCNSQAFWAA